MQPKEHDPEKTGLQEEGGQDFQGDHWSNRWTGDLCKPGKAETEFERQHDPGDDANAKTHGKDTEPEAVDLKIDRHFGFQPQALDNHQECRRARSRSSGR